MSPRCLLSDGYFYTLTRLDNDVVAPLDNIVDEVKFSDGLLEPSCRTKSAVEPCWVVAVASQPLMLMMRMLSVGHLLLIDVDDEGCMLWAQFLNVVATAQPLLSLSISMSMLGSLLHCLHLMTNDEPDGGTAMTTGVLPNQDDEDADGLVAVDEADAAAVSCGDVEVVTPMPPAPAELMIVVVVSIDHLG